MNRVEQKYGITNLLCQSELQRLVDEKVIYTSEYRGNVSYRIVGWTFNRKKKSDSELRGHEEDTCQKMTDFSSLSMRDVICEILNSCEQEDGWIPVFCN